MLLYYLSVMFVHDFLNMISIYVLNHFFCIFDSVLLIELFWSLVRMLSIVGRIGYEIYCSSIGYVQKLDIIFASGLFMTINWLYLNFNIKRICDFVNDFYIFSAIKCCFFLSYMEIILYVLLGHEWYLPLTITGIAD